MHLAAATWLGNMLFIITEECSNSLRWGLDMWHRVFCTHNISSDLASVCKFDKSSRQPRVMPVLALHLHRRVCDLCMLTGRMGTLSMTYCIITSTGHSWQPTSTQPLLQCHIVCNLMIHTAKPKIFIIRISINIGPTIALNINGTMTIWVVTSLIYEGRLSSQAVPTKHLCQDSQNLIHRK